MFRSTRRPLAIPAAVEPLSRPRLAGSDRRSASLAARETNGFGHRLERLPSVPIQRAGPGEEEDATPAKNKKPRLSAPSGAPGVSIALSPSPASQSVSHGLSSPPPRIPPSSSSQPSTLPPVPWPPYPVGPPALLPPDVARTPSSLGVSPKRKSPEPGSDSPSPASSSSSSTEGGPGSLVPLSAEEAYAALDVRSRIPNIGKRALVATAERRAFLSGYGGATAEQSSILREAGLEPAANRPQTDRAWRIGHVFPEDVPSTIGAKWHADPAGLVESSVIGDSFRQCDSCQGFAVREAIGSGATKTVLDPNFRRTYRPIGPNAKEQGQTGFGAAGFGRAQVTKEEVRGRLGKPLVRREDALAFPGGVTVAEQEHRPNQTIFRFPNTARLRLPAEASSAEEPKLLRRPPRQSLNSKSAEGEIRGAIRPIRSGDAGERRIHFETPEGLLIVTTDAERPVSLKLHPSGESRAEASEVSLSGGVEGLVGGEARVKPRIGRELRLSRLGDPGGRAHVAPVSEAAPAAPADPTQPFPSPAAQEGAGSSFLGSSGLTEEDVLQYFAFEDRQKGAEEEF